MAKPMTRAEWENWVEKAWATAQGFPIKNRARDKAWEAFIKRKDVKEFMKDKPEFKFPLDGSYEMWCVAWDKAWHDGFNAGYRKAWPEEK